MSDLTDLLRASPAARALLGCDFGTLVSTPDDRDPCVAQATQRVQLHDGGVARPELKLCERHRAVIDAECEPPREPEHHDLVLQPYNGMGDDWYQCSRCGLRYCPEYDEEPEPTCPA